MTDQADLVRLIYLDELFPRQAMRFHVLGIGSIGTLISHHLRLAVPTSPISLIVKRAAKFSSTRLYPFGKSGDLPITLTVERDGQTSTSTGFELEVWHDGRAERIVRSKGVGTQEGVISPPNGPINSLVVCLKTSATVSALQTLQSRLSPSSVVTLVQNGMGVYDELCSSIWPDPKTRPFFVIGTTTHGATPDKTGGMVHHRSKPGEGDFKWGVVSDPRKEVDLEAWLWGKTVSNTPILAPPSSPSLPLRPTPPCTTDLEPLSETITALLSISQLSPSLLPVPHLHHQLLLKLALNSVINPLTAIIGAGSLPNGALANSSPSYRLIRDLCRETSSVLTVYLHSLSAPHTPPFDVIRLFSWEGLERRILALIHATAENMSSMAVDVSKGRTTEIEHINGYIVALGKRLSVETPCHRIVREMVKFTAEVNGLKPAFAETSDLVADRRAGIQGKLGRGRQLSSRQMDIEEKRLELEERRLYLAEEQMLENKRARRRIARSAKEIHSARNDMAVRRDLMESALNRGIVPDSKEDVADVTAAENPEHSIDTPSVNHEVQAAPKATAGPAQTRTAATNEPRATPPQIVTDAGDTAPPRSSPQNGSYYYSRDDAPRNQQSLSASAK